MFTITNRMVKGFVQEAITHKTPIKKIDFLVRRYRGDLSIGRVITQHTTTNKRFSSTSTKSSTFSEEERTKAETSTTPSATARPANMRRHRLVYVARAQSKKLHTSVNLHSSLEQNLDGESKTHLFASAESCSPHSSSDSSNSSDSNSNSSPFSWLAAFPFK